jgi:hypothetical protein
LRRLRGALGYEPYDARSLVSCVPARLDDLPGRRTAVAGLACRLPPSRAVSLANPLADTVANLVRGVRQTPSHHKATVVG